jgi:hypothetical protein
MNVELLQQIKAAILAEPLKFDMSAWFHADQNSPCGTAACIAGWAVTIQMKAEKLREARFAYDAGDGNEGVERDGKKALGLTDQQAYRLFFYDTWPVPFRHEYSEASGFWYDDPVSGEFVKGAYVDRRVAAEVAARRIDHFIATEGRE